MEKKQDLTKAITSRYTVMADQKLQTLAKNMNMPKATLIAQMVESHYEIMTKKALYPKK